jgi:hypothetical protein
MLFAAGPLASACLVAGPPRFSFAFEIAISVALSFLRGRLVIHSPRKRKKKAKKAQLLFLSGC